MIDLYYSVVPSENAQEAMSLPGCATQEPRLSVDGATALLAYDESADGRMTQEETITLMSTEEWADPTEVAQ
tara:strand:- start:261 stop:476 length:216 start_codon:yes stop_codon:yes gene_type:complete